MNYLQVAQDFVYAAKAGKETIAFTENLAGGDIDHLVQILDNDNKRKAFWINIYNGFIRAQLSASPELFTRRESFFRKKSIIIACSRFSFDFIEHAILRKSKLKFALGFLSNPFPSTLEKQLRITSSDYRIHFALNCGATSCPPIAYYDYTVIDKQLELATRSYLETEVKLMADVNTVFLPKQMLWFLGDFGGRKGIFNILKKHGVVNGDRLPRIKFKEYDWALKLNN